MCSRTAIDRGPRVPIIRLGFAASLLVAATLIGSTLPCRADGSAATTVSVERQAPPDDPASPAKPAPAQPARATQPQFVGAVGFGWG